MGRPVCERVEEQFEIGRFTATDVTQMEPFCQCPGSVMRVARIWQGAILAVSYEL